MTTRGGSRPNAGRPKGTKNLRTIAATELLAEAQEKFPDFNPISALIALAQSAMAEDAEKPDPILAKDCYVAVLPYLAPRFKPIEADIERVVELEARLARVKLEAQAQLLHDRPDLADRLERAAQRVYVVTGVPRMPDEELPETIEGQLADRLARAGVNYAPPTPRLSPPEEPQDVPPAASAGPAPAAPAAPTAKPVAPASPAPAPEPYQPIMPPPGSSQPRFGRTMTDDYRPFED